MKANQQSQKGNSRYSRVRLANSTFPTGGILIYGKASPADKDENVFDKKVRMFSKCMLKVEAERLAEVLKPWPATTMTMTLEKEVSFDYSKGVFLKRER